MQKLKALTKLQEKTLFKLCKVWGFVKYYHPVVASGKLDWDEELFRIMPQLISLEESKEVDEVIYNWINSLGQVEEDRSPKEEKELRLQADLEWIRDKAFIDEKLSELLIKIENSKRSDNNYYVKLNKDIDNPAFTNEKIYEEMDYEDGKYKLLSLFRYWNIMQYFYPYRYAIDESLDSILEQFIPKMFQCNDELSYKLALYELIGKIQDGHAWLYLENDKTLTKFWGENIAPIIVSELENKIVVERKLKELDLDTNIEIGDVILEIDGRRIEEVIKEKEKYVPATNRNYHNHWLFKFLLRTNEENMDLAIERNSACFKTKIRCIKDENIFDSILLKEEDAESHRFITDEIVYIRPSKLMEEEFEVIKEKFKNTKGVIIDNRYYPSSSAIWSFMDYAMPQPRLAAKFSKPCIENPGEFEVIETGVVGDENNKENLDYYKGMIVGIINEESMSQPEFLSMAIRVAPKGILVGSPSAGADGNCSFIRLPGNIMTCYTGLGVYYPDGRETQRVGIIPDIEVRQTIQGIRQGRDELLEKAIEVINASN